MLNNVVVDCCNSISFILIGLVIYRPDSTCGKSSLLVREVWGSKP